MNQFITKEEVLVAGFTEEELEEAAGYYETDVDKEFLAGYLDRDEQLGYLNRARFNLNNKKAIEQTVSKSNDEVFTINDTVNALEQFLKFGEEQFNKSHKGYYSGNGWPARVLRKHLEELKKDHCFCPQPCILCEQNIEHSNCTSS